MSALVKHSWPPTFFLAMFQRPMPKPRQPESANLDADSANSKSETLPTITHLQFVMLDLLMHAGDEVPAQLLKDGVARVSSDYDGPKFYQLMGRLVDAALVAATSRQVEVAGGTVKRSFYKLAPAGKVAWRVTTEFYTSRQKLRAATECDR